MHRRHFLAAATTVATAAGQTATAAGQTGPGVIDNTRDPQRFGLDLWSVRSQGWNAFQYIDHAVQQKLRVIQFADSNQLGSLDPEHARNVKAYADQNGVLLEMGMGTICPTASGWNAKKGPIEPWILRHVEAAKLMGSPILRCLLGSARERKGDIPLAKHTEAMLHALRNIRSQVTDMGVMMAIENHSGDYQGRELAPVVEEAGKDWVGVVFDSGNPIWTIEDPMVALEHLAPYIVSSHLRDSYVWLTDEGVAARWVVFGEGNVGTPELLRTLLARCPKASVLLETITVRHNDLKVKQPDFWKGYENVPANEYMRFYALAEKGKPQPPLPRLTSEQMAERQLVDSNQGLVNARRMFTS
ncbi:MAG: sugar phosphate isomerase/epimerase [Bryobacterales bacterium]|jgi:sugar phosphate isomerase/epimerase|nr:sugar phosphate isomerase/epimerase [Bryobacterales bacterium]